MANWDQIKQKGNVEDRRSSNVVTTVWWIGLWTIALLLAVGYFGGADTALELLDTIQSTQGTQQEQVLDGEDLFAGEDAYETFVAKVLGSADTLRGNAFSRSGIEYTKPKLVLFRGSTQSACGGAVSQAWPHYCPIDQTIYLDETFFEDLETKFGAQGGDVAEAYVIAHEVGHHIQTLLGVTQKVQQVRQYDNDASIRLELQADCYAGIRASTVQWIFEKDEIYEAIDAAAAVGDDRIQKRTMGEVHPESWTHGSSQQRKERFAKGYEYADFAQCDTFG